MDCNTIAVAVFIPNEINITDAFGNWATPSGAAYRVFADGLQCQRVSIDNFERGPVTFVFERHEYYIEPETCFKGRVGGLGIISLVLVDDAEIAAHLRNVYRMNAMAASIWVEESNPTPLERTETWYWQPEGFETSYAASTQLYATDPSDLPFKERQYWDLKPGVGVMEWTISGPVDQISPRPLPIHMATPHLYARMGVPDSATYGEIASHQNLEAPIKMYGDYACNELVL